MKRTAVLYVAVLYQAILNALSPWPYGPVVMGRYTQRFVDGGTRGEIEATIVDTWR